VLVVVVVEVIVEVDVTVEVEVDVTVEVEVVVVVVVVVPPLLATVKKARADIENMMAIRTSPTASLLKEGKFLLSSFLVFCSASES
jgi:hypothetical protein